MVTPRYMVHVYGILLLFYKQPKKYLLNNLLNNLSPFPGFQNIYFTTREYQRRKEASEEKEVFVYIIWRAKQTKKALVFII